MDRNDLKVRRRMIVLGESEATRLYFAEIGASNEVQELIDIIDGLVERVYVLGEPAKLRVSE